MVVIARDLLGTYLFTRAADGEVTGGRIVETEAYSGPEDRASHAFGNRRTARTEVMFHAGGVTYVYFCYGMHSLLNVVTGLAGVPQAILIRALEPTRGMAAMLERRRLKKADRRLTGGPGRVAEALGIDTGWSGMSLVGNRIWIEDRGHGPAAADVVAGPRVGVAYAGADAILPWRFRIRGCQWTSQAE